MQPTNPRNALLALTARLIADNQPVTLLELADLADVSHDVMRRALNELETAGLTKNHGRVFEMRLSNREHIARAIDQIAAGTFKLRGAA
jgi:DeoR/GlpR family transcriptional regulator of sugar metabolism